jgi:hypothetical protein
VPLPEITESPLTQANAALANFYGANL